MPAPFRAESYELPLRDGGCARLEKVGAEAAELAAAIVAIDPWRRMGYGAESMAAYLARRDDDGARHLIRRDGMVAGAVCVRHPWLRGPYLELLALLPDHQGSGLGAAVLRWMESEARGLGRSLWVCTSDFNSRALAFDERHGFHRVADLPGLVGPGFTEILLRKPLA